MFSPEPQMHICIDSSLSPPSVSLIEADDFRAFDVVLIGKDEAAFAAEIERLGVPTGEGHVLVEPERVKALAGSRAQDSTWSRSFAEMVEYAAALGWIDDAGRIRAHIVNPSG